MKNSVLFYKYNNIITPIWVPAYRGITGNEEADSLAKRGTKKKLYGPSSFCGVPIERAKSRIKEWLRLEAINDLHKVIDARHSRSFINKPRVKGTSYLLKESRTELRLLTGFLTCHGPFI